MNTYSFEISSSLSVSPEAFWAQFTLAEVNRELAPWVRMTAPPAWRSVPLRQWPEGQRLFRSWILLFGVLPVDLHALYLHRITPGVGFEERSRSAMNRRWDHTRRTEPTPRGSRLIDRVEYESRLPLTGALFLPIYKAIFASRHRYLRHAHAGIEESR